MKRSSFFLMLILLLGSCACSKSVHAEIFRWQDPDTGIQANYPDTWGRINNQKPDDKLTIAAPNASKGAQCRIRLRKDNRFTIHPAKHADEIQRTQFSRKFWDQYLGEYDDVTLHGLRDNGALGRGHASYIEASYTTTAGPEIQKRALLGATLYYDKVYIYECAAAEDSFKQHYPAFTQILKSVTFSKIIHGHPNGEYRLFTGDPTLGVHHSDHPVDRYVQ